MRMRLSIIVPVYNVEHYLERCIVSCESQDISSEDYEVVAVNDGSTDNSLSVLNKLAERYSNLVVISQENQGLSGARMAGLNKALGKYVWFVDSDDWIADNCLGKLLRRLEENELDALQICAATSKNGIIERLVNSKNSLVCEGKQFINEHLLWMCVPFTIYRKDFLLNNELSFYQGIYHEDFQFTPRAYYHATRVMSINEIAYFYYLDSVSIMRSINPKKAYDYVIVAESLFSFKQIINDCKTAFNYYISMAINNSLNNIHGLNSSQIEDLNDFLFSKRYLFNCLIKSKHAKYIIEGIFFKSFPRRVCRTYSLLSSLYKFV